MIFAHRLSKEFNSTFLGVTKVDYFTRRTLKYMLKIKKEYADVLANWIKTSYKVDDVLKLASAIISQNCQVLTVREPFSTCLPLLSAIPINSVVDPTGCFYVLLSSFYRCCLAATTTLVVWSMLPPIPTLS